MLQSIEKAEERPRSITNSKNDAEKQIKHEECKRIHFFQLASS